MGNVVRLNTKTKKLRIDNRVKQATRQLPPPLDPQAIEELYRPEETGEPDEFENPLSTCCAEPPLQHIQLCSRCRDHCGWYEGT